MAIDGMMESEDVLDDRMHRQGRGVGGVGIGDTMAVTANGCDARTPAPYFWPR